MRKAMSRPWSIGWMVAAGVAGFYAVSLLFHFGAVASPPLAAVALAGDAVAAETPSGELIYVPAYPSILYEEGNRTLQLDTTLSIHNVNPDRKITITRVDYYNADGKLVKKYLAKPQTLNPLQTQNFVVEKIKAVSGVGANFLVEWQASQEVNSPIVETLMMNASSNLGVSFSSTGRVLKRFPPPAK
jgi:hypothetical protein